MIAARGMAAVAALLLNCVAAICIAAQPEGVPEPPGTAPAPAQDSAYFDADGTAHITRVVPVPSMISPEARQWLESLTHHPQIARPLADQRIAMDQWRAL